MAQNSGIEWTDATWNPLAGCTEISPGCRNCYAAVMAHRLEAMGQEKYKGTTRKAASGKVVWTGKVNLDPKALAEPLKRRKPTRYFVNSMSDLFHESVPDGFIDRVFRTMIDCQHHTFQVLTKRPDRMAKYCGDRWGTFYGKEYALPRNVWLGVSVDDQQRADERIPLLLQTPAAVRFLSCEPLLGSVDLSKWIMPPTEGQAFFDALGGVCGGIIGKPVGRVEYRNSLHWVIVGGESGPGARPMHPNWATSIRDQCQAARVPFFFKQWGEWLPDPCQDWAENQVTEFPDGIGMWRHGYLCRKYEPERGRKLEGRLHEEFPEVASNV